MLLLLLQRMVALNLPGLLRQRLLLHERWLRPLRLQVAVPARPDQAADAAPHGASGAVALQLWGIGRPMLLLLWWKRWVAIPPWTHRPPKS